MYNELWKITNLSTGEVTICEADQILAVLLDYTEPWACTDEYITNEIHATCVSISKQCLSGCKDICFNADCSWLNIRLDRMPEYMTAEDLFEFLFE